MTLCKKPKVRTYIYNIEFLKNEMTSRVQLINQYMELNLVNNWQIISQKQSASRNMTFIEKYIDLNKIQKQLIRKMMKYTYLYLIIFRNYELQIILHSSLCLIS